MIWAVFALLSAVFAVLTFILATVVHERTTAQQAISTGLRKGIIYPIAHRRCKPSTTAASYVDFEPTINTSPFPDFSN